MTPRATPSPVARVTPSPSPVASVTPSPSQVASASPSPTPLHSADASPEPNVSPASTPSPGTDRRAKRLFEPVPPIPTGKSVRIRFTIAADGKSTPTLMAGTGDPAADAKILEVLQTWKWEPAVSDGRKADSVEVFRLSGGEATAQ